MDLNSEGKCDVDDLAVSLGKRLGRLEVSGLEMVEQLVEMVDRCGIVEEALVEEHVVREADEKRISQLEEIIKNLETRVDKNEENEDNRKLEKKMTKLEEEQREAKKHFLLLVENCEGMELKVQQVEKLNRDLVEEVNILKTEKETIMKSLKNNPNLTNIAPVSKAAPFLATSAPSLPISISVSQITSPPIVRPIHRVPLFQVTIHIHLT